MRGQTLHNAMPSALETAMPWLVRILRCSLCGGDMTNTDGRITCTACSAVFQVSAGGLRILSAQGSTRWTQAQDESVARYEGDDYNKDTTIPRLFGGFIASTVGARDVVVDVGCGIDAQLPAYVSELGMSQYLGVEPLEVDVPRVYPCLMGCLAEQLPLKDNSVGAIVYATSLDHIEDSSKALQEAHRVLKPGGRVFIWSGVHEPEVVARATGSMYAWFFKGSALRRAAVGIFPHAALAKLMSSLALRAVKLRLGLPLDDIHFRYYTRATLRAELEDAGFAVVRELVVPGTASFFVECQGSDPS